MNSMQSALSQDRAIGLVGTIARIVLGLVFLFPAVLGNFDWTEWILGLVGFPLLLLLFQHIRLRYRTQPLQATGPIGFVVNMLIFLALYLTPLYFPPLSITSDATLIFFGVSMLLAAVRGYAGCEVLAISNWLLGRDDQVGCVIFSPVDAIETRLAGKSRTNQN